jgi:hypothetical protein
MSRTIRLHALSLSDCGRGVDEDHRLSLGGLTPPRLGGFAPRPAEGEVGPAGAAEEWQRGRREERRGQCTHSGLSSTRGHSHGDR